MKNRKGLTLIEVIISIAIITIIAITFLGMFEMGITNIFNAGKRTKRVFETQSIIDKNIKDNENSTTGSHEIKVKIPGVSEEQIIDGTLIEEQNPEDPNIKITTFVPNK